MKYISFNKILFAFIIAIILYIVYYNYRTEIFTNHKNNSEFSIIYYYNTDCDYCNRFEPEWRILNYIYKSRNCKLQKKNSKDRAVQKEMIERNIQGYPSIYIITDKGSYKYNGSMKAVNIDNFISTIYFYR